MKTKLENADYLRSSKTDMRYGVNIQSTHMQIA